MSTEQLTALARRYFDYLDRRDLDGLLTTYAPTTKFHGLAPVALDPAGVKAAMTAFYTAFPDSRMPYQTIVAEGDTVSIRHQFLGTHQAEFQGVPATGKSVTVDAIVTLKVKDGKVTEAWLNADLFGLLMQIGAIPSPGH
jgi:steroid delta-isomerase-like uncharacterized protein